MASVAAAISASGIADERRGIVGGDAEDQRRHQARQPEGERKPHDQAGADGQHAAPEDHGEHVVPLRAQRHADADLVGLLRDHVGHHAIHADGREQQRQHTENAHQHRHVVQADGAVVNGRLHGPHVGDGLLGVHRADGGGDRGRQAQRVARRFARRYPSTAAAPAGRERTWCGAARGRRGCA